MGAGWESSVPNEGRADEVSPIPDAAALARMFRPEGKTAWITGAARGLGLRMAHVLAAAGANIVINARTPGTAEAAAAEVAGRHGVRALGVQGDVTSEEDAIAVAQRAASEVGGIDILITSAGVNCRKSTLEMSMAEWRRVIDINLTGAFACSKAAAPQMVDRGWGRIVHIASMLGHVGLAARPPYTASKGGLIQLARTQALEFAKSGVTVNALCPGPFGTEMNRPLLNDAAAYAAFVEKIPLGRWGEMHELDGAILFLASEASSFMTGAALTVDGGWTAQ